MMIFKHPGHVKILDGNDVKPLYEHRGQLVQGIRSEIHPPGMQSGDALLGFPACSPTSPILGLSGDR